MVEKASIEDVMKVLQASHKQDMQQLYNTCTHLVAKSGLPPEILAKHLPFEIVAKINELRLTSSFTCRRLSPLMLPLAEQEEQQKIRRMRRALDSSDVELVKLMVMGEGLNLDDALALHYAVQYCSREVVKALLEFGPADVNRLAAPAGKTPLHIAAEMVCPDMVAVLLDHHADPNVRTAHVGNVAAQIQSFPCKGICVENRVQCTVECIYIMEGTATQSTLLDGIMASTTYHSQRYHDN